MCRQIVYFFCSLTNKHESLKSLFALALHLGPASPFLRVTTLPTWIAYLRHISLSLSRTLRSHLLFSALCTPNKKIPEKDLWFLIVTSSLQIQCLSLLNMPDMKKRNSEWKAAFLWCTFSAWFSLSLNRGEGKSCRHHHWSLLTSNSM